MTLQPNPQPVKSEREKSIEILDAAFDYSGRFKWSVVFIGDEKKPLERWKWMKKRLRRSQEVAKAHARIASRNRPIRGLGVIFGRTSGNLVGRDWDTERGYQEWKHLNPEIADDLPTVKTARGYMTFCRVRDPNSVAFKKIYGRWRGEIRWDSYSIMPPSLHPIGIEYAWEGAKPEKLAEIPIYGSTACLGWERQKRKVVVQVEKPKKEISVEVTAPEEAKAAVIETDIREEEVVEELEVNNLGTTSLILDRKIDRIDGEIERSVTHSLPSRVGERWHKIGSYVSRLKGLNLGSATDEFKIHLFDLWWEKAVGIVGTKERSESVKDFLSAWDSAITPIRRREAFRKIASATESFIDPIPDCPSLYEFRDQESYRRLWSTIVALSDRGLKEFLLSQRYAQEMCGFKDHRTARRAIDRFVGAGLIEKMEKDYGKDDAFCYRYVWKG